MSIVTSPPRKRAKAAAIEAPAIVAIDPKTRVAKKSRRLVGSETAAEGGSSEVTCPGRAGDADHSTPAERRRDPAVTAAGKAPQPANEDSTRKSAITTARKAGKAIPDGLLPDTPEELERRREAADELWRELVRRVASDP